MISSLVWIAPPDAVADSGRGQRRGVLFVNQKKKKKKKKKQNWWLTRPLATAFG